MKSDEDAVGYVNKLFSDILQDEQTDDDDGGHITVMTAGKSVESLEAPGKKIKVLPIQPQQQRSANNKAAPLVPPQHPQLTSFKPCLKPIIKTTNNGSNGSKQAAGTGSSDRSKVPSNMEATML